MPQDIDFFMPYRMKVAASLPARIGRHFSWAQAHGFMPSPAAAERYLLSQHAEVGAWFCPEPEEDRDLDLQLDENGWIFMLDDAFDVPAGQSADGAVAICQTLMELLHDRLDLRGGASSPLVSAFADVWRRECEGMSAFWRQRAICTWTGYIAGNLVEEANRRHGALLTPGEYLSVRRKSVGVLPTYDMRECMGPFEVPLLAWYSSHLMIMRRLSVEHVIMVNEVCSLEKDEARDEINFVRLLISQQGLSRDAAIDRAVELADDRLRQSQRLESGIPGLCDRLDLKGAARSAVFRHVESIRDMVAGNYYWSRTCGRYGPQATARIAPDQPGLLGLHDLT